MRLLCGSCAFLPLFAAFMTLGPGLAFGQDSGAAALQHLQGKDREARQLFQQRQTPARDERITRLLNELLDYDELSRLALADHWESRSPAERTEFVALLRQLVERSFRSNIERTLNYQVDYSGHEPAEPGVLVHTEARSRENRRAPPIEIDYGMHQANSDWRVYDIITDGVSLVRNYRSQFNRIIQRDGWSGLIQRMRSRLDEGNEG